MFAVDLSKLNSLKADYTPRLSAAQLCHQQVPSLLPPPSILIPPPPTLVNRHSVARAILETTLSLIHFSHSFPPDLQITFPPTIKELGIWNFERMFTPHYLLHVTCHASHVPHIFIFYLFLFCFGASRLRVCYQRSLPRLLIIMLQCLAPVLLFTNDYFIDKKKTKLLMRQSLGLFGPKFSLKEYILNVYFLQDVQPQIPCIEEVK